MMQHQILIVDDEPNILRALYRVLRREGYRIQLSAHPQEALTWLQEHPVCLILSDYRMPEMDGITLLKEARRLHPDSIRMILSGYADIQTLLSAINEGEVYKFLTKPWEDDVLRVEIRRALERYELGLRNRRLLEEIEEKNRHLREVNRRLEAQMEALRTNVVQTIEALARLPRLKDPALVRNPKRVGWLCRALGERMGLSEEALRDLEIAAQLHDIGNLGVDSRILNKSGPLTPEERKAVEQSVLLADEVLRPLPGFEGVRKIIRYHHEHFDGSGYPEGLRGEAIPLTSRILCVADVYDSLRSPRPFRPPFSPDEVVAFLERERGRMFDPHLVDLTLEILRRDHEPPEQPDPPAGG